MQVPRETAQDLLDEGWKPGHHRNELVGPELMNGWGPQYRHFCDSCRTLDPHSYMVHDAVWKAACTNTPKDALLCLPCLEARLGRPLVREDFNSSVDINKELLFGYEMGVRESSKKR